MFCGAFREKESPMTNEMIHQLWLIYSQLKDAESDSSKQLELLERSREELGELLNEMYRRFPIASS